MVSGAGSRGQGENTFPEKLSEASILRKATTLTVKFRGYTEENSNGTFLAFIVFDPSTPALGCSCERTNLPFYGDSQVKGARAASPLLSLKSQAGPGSSSSRASLAPSRAHAHSNSSALGWVSQPRCHAARLPTLLWAASFTIPYCARADPAIFPW